MVRLTHYPQLKLTPTGDWDYAYSIVQKYPFNSLDHASFRQTLSLYLVQMWRLEWEGKPFGFASISHLPHDVYSFDLYDDITERRRIGARDTTAAAVSLVSEAFFEAFPGRTLCIFPDVRNRSCIRTSLRVGFRPIGDVEILGRTHKCLFLLPPEPRSRGVLPPPAEPRP